MKLVSLTSNMESFNPVIFNETGLSIITAVKRTQDERKTYNSVGKSLTISLIHFCLGSNPIEEYKEKLPGWEFYLEFRIGNEEYRVERSTDNQDVIKLNNEDYTISNFNKEMANKIFDIPPKSKYISFRGLISRFIRPKKFSYNHYNKVIPKENMSISEAINNAFLIGLDINKILKKEKLKKDLDDISSKKKNIEKDDVLKGFFKGSDKDGNVEIEIVELETEIDLLKSNLDNFRVAEDYYSIQKDADEISNQLRTHKNRASKLRNAILNIEKSLDLKPDISRKKLIKFYNEADFQLGDILIRRLKEVEDFNKKLLSNRSIKLFEDKTRFENSLNETLSVIKSLGKKENEKLKYLNAHGALDEYTSLNKQLTDKEIRLDKLQNYKNLIEEYQEKIDNLEKDFIDQNTDTRKYISSNKKLIDENIKLFKSFVNKFYSGKSSGIAISVNDGQNKIRYDINARISDDSGDSVNEVKIFCYDWTILKGQHGHNVKFLFHDSRILDGLDARQLRTLFEVAHSESNSGDFQYIISLNQFQLDILENKMSDEEGKFEKIISENIILELSDASDEDKLLGVQVDLKYDVD